MKKPLLFISLFFALLTSYSQVTTTVNPTIAQLQQKLQGNGVTITNVSITCPAGAYALYSGGTGALSTLSSGILLTTGTASNVQAPFSGFNSLDNSAAGTTLGDNLDLSGSGTYDACYLTFLITPNCNTLSINYVFASEEYPENVGFGVSDVFGFVIDGPNPSGPAYNQQNIALVPGTNLPVSIDNVNYDPGFPPFLPPVCTNCAYYVDSPPGMVYDGCTTVLTASTAVVPCQQYTMTIGVWDVGDGVYDSGVFLDVNGLSCVGNPTLTTVASPSVICGPQTVTLTAGGGLSSGTYTWSAPASGGLVTTVGQTVTANPTATTIYTLSYSDLNTCPGVPLTKTVSVTFSAGVPLPVSVTPASICAGQTATLTSAGGVGTYSWSPGATLSTTSNSVTIANPTTTTTYTVTKTTGGCTSSTVVTVSVTAASGLTVTPSSSAICPGQSASFTASGGSTYTWTASSGANPASVASVTVSPTTTTTYTVLSTCSASAVVTVTVSAATSVSISPAVTSICAGQSATLTALGGSTYTWTASSGTNPPNGSPVVVAPTSSTTYTVLTGSGTCTASAVANVNITSAPVLTLAPLTSTICAGQTVNLNVSGGSTYTWTASSGANPPNSANVSVSPTTNTTYTVLTGSGTCTASAIASVNVLSGVTPTITSSSPTICVSQTVSMSVSPAISGLTYTWLPASAIQGANNTSTILASPTTTATVIYTVTVSNGVCSGTATVALQPLVCSSPTATIQTTTNDSICTNGCVTFTAATSGAGPLTYQWYFNGGTPLTSNLSNPQICYFAKGNYSVSLVISNSYGSNTVTTTSNFINVADTPAVFTAFGDTTIKIGQFAPVSASGALNYYWYPNINGSIACPTCSNTVVQPTVTTSYVVQASNSPYCKRTDTVVVKVDFVCGDFFVPNAFSPNGDGLNDVINVHGFCIGTFNLQIFNRWGEKVFESTSKSDGWDGTFRGKNMDTGVFVYRADGITIDGKPFNIKGNITLIR
jgi:gliding motility-associated-like protein